MWVARPLRTFSTAQLGSDPEGARFESWPGHRTPWGASFRAEGPDFGGLETLDLIFFMQF
jgi:hypothetical protein